MKTICSWNVNGIRAAARKGLAQWITSEKPDILALQETKARRDQLDSEVTAIEGYASYFFPAEKAGYSGVALYSRREPLAVEPLHIDAFDTEGRVLVATYTDFTLINCYFPNSQAEGRRLDYKLAFCNAIHERCNALVADGHNIILCGDYNIAHTPIDLKNPKNNERNPGFLPEERAWMTSFLDAGYVDTFRHFHPDEAGHYTWWSYRFKAREKDIGWRIDYLCVNSDLLPAVYNAAIHKTVTGSDHCPVSITLDL